MIVQNVGNRAFTTTGNGARLNVTMAGTSLGAFPIGRLGASEVKFFSAETALPPGGQPGDITASLDLDAGATDCQLSDNVVTRKGQSIRLAAQN